MPRSTSGHLGPARSTRISTSRQRGFAAQHALGKASCQLRADLQQKCCSHRSRRSRASLFLTCREPSEAEHHSHANSSALPYEPRPLALGLVISMKQISRFSANRPSSPCNYLASNFGSLLVFSGRIMYTALQSPLHRVSYLRYKSRRGSVPGTHLSLPGTLSGKL